MNAPNTPILLEINRRFNNFPPAENVDTSRMVGIGIASQPGRIDVKTTPGGSEGVFHRFVMKVSVSDGIFGQTPPTRVDTGLDRRGYAVATISTAGATGNLTEKGESIYPDDTGFDLFMRLRERLANIKKPLGQAILAATGRELEPQSLYLHDMHIGLSSGGAIRGTVWRIGVGGKQMTIRLNACTEGTVDQLSPMEYLVGFVDLDGYAVGAPSQEGLIAFRSLHDSIRSLWVPGVSS